MKLRLYKLTHESGPEMVDELIIWLPDGSVRKGTHCYLVGDESRWEVVYRFSFIRQVPPGWVHRLLRVID